MSAIWPLFDLRLRTQDLLLRPTAEQQALDLAAVVPDDLEQDPRAVSYAGAPRANNRQNIVLQGIWHSWGTWSPQEWNLPFAAYHGSDLVGFQTLEGSDFVATRTVDTASWLVPDARGRGWGKQMRRAVLGLAFGPLAARYAISSAWHDNAASLGVSASLGYRPNGRSALNAGDRVDELVHLRMTREQWDSRGGGTGVGIDGFEACRAYFGL